MNAIGTNAIRTQRLVLRKMQPSDALDLYDAGALGETLDEAKEAVTNMIRYNDDPLNFHWVLEYKGKAIGRVKAWEVSTRDSYAQLGYDVGSAYRCRGFTTEAVNAVVRYLLTDAEFNRVYAMVRENNIASIRVCEKAGMLHEGTMRKHFVETNGSFSDVRVYGILASDLST